MKLFKGCTEGVHRFEARYDKSPAEFQVENLSGSGIAWATVLEKLQQVTYVHDICVRCGKTIFRTNAS